MGVGRWGKRLSDSQELLVPSPPDENAAAIIDMFSIQDAESREGTNDICLCGIVSRLTLERNSGRIFATIMAGNVPFVVGLSLQQFQDRALFPGKTIFIRYSLDHIKWV